MAALEVVVPAGLDGVRVDRAVALLTDRSRTSVGDLVAAGRIRVDGAVVARGSRLLRSGQRLVVDGGEGGDAPDDLAPDPEVTFEVVFADPEVVVVDKPAGLVVHPGAGHRDRTLVHGLLARFPDLRGLGRGPGDDPQRPGIVHRLDRGTSGLLVVARTPRAAESLVAQLAARRARRGYVALVEGIVEDDRGVVDAPIGRSSRDPTKMAVTRRGRPARTGYDVDRRFPGEPASLLRLTLETGRTHQIRVHLAAIGHPVRNDDVYGRRRRRHDEELPPARPFLHAAELGFAHPATGTPMSFTSPLPEDLAAVLERLEREAGSEA